MTRRDLAKAALGSAILTQTNARDAGATKPNIVLMLTDNLGYGELGVYGGGILRGAPTPRIDTFASQGIHVDARCITLQLG
jgi:hypothetical protein